MPHIVLSLHGNSNRSGALEGARLAEAQNCPPGPVDAAPFAELPPPGDRLRGLMTDPRDGTLDQFRHLLDADVLVGGLRCLDLTIKDPKPTSCPLLQICSLVDDADHGCAVGPVLDAVSRASQQGPRLPSIPTVTRIALHGRRGVAKRRGMCQGGLVADRKACRRLHNGIRNDTYRPETADFSNHLFRGLRGGFFRNSWRRRSCSDNTATCSRRRSTSGLIIRCSRKRSRTSSDCVRLPSRAR